MIDAVVPEKSHRRCNNSRVFIFFLSEKIKIEE